MITGNRISLELDVGPRPRAPGTVGGIPPGVSPETFNQKVEDGGFLFCPARPPLTDHMSQVTLWSHPDAKTAAAAIKGQWVPYSFGASLSKVLDLSETDDVRKQFLKIGQSNAAPPTTRAQAEDMIPHVTTSFRNPPKRFIMTGAQSGCAMVLVLHGETLKVYHDPVWNEDSFAKPIRYADFKAPWDQHRFGVAEAVTHPFEWSSETGAPPTGIRSITAAAADAKGDDMKSVPVAAAAAAAAAPAAASASAAAVPAAGAGAAAAAVPALSAAQTAAYNAGQFAVRESPVPYKDFDKRGYMYVPREFTLSGRGRIVAAFDWSVYGTYDPRKPIPANGLREGTGSSFLYYTADSRPHPKAVGGGDAASAADAKHAPAAAGAGAAAGAAAGAGQNIKTEKMYYCWHLVGQAHLYATNALRNAMQASIKGKIENSERIRIEQSSFAYDVKPADAGKDKARLIAPLFTIQKSICLVDTINSATKKVISSQWLEFMDYYNSAQHFKIEVR